MSRRCIVFLPLIIPKKGILRRETRNHTCADNSRPNRVQWFAFFFELVGVVYHWIEIIEQVINLLFVFPKYTWKYTEKILQFWHVIPAQEVETNFIRARVTKYRVLRKKKKKKNRDRSRVPWSLNSRLDISQSDPRKARAEKRGKETKRKKKKKEPPTPPTTSNARPRFLRKKSSWNEGRRLVYQESRGRARARLPILVPRTNNVNASTSNESKRVQVRAEAEEPKRWKVARILAIRFCHCQLQTNEKEEKSAGAAHKRD